MAGEGCALVATESTNEWVSTGNDSSPENSSRQVRVSDTSGAILGYRVTPTPVLAIRMFKPENVSDESAQIIIVTQMNIFIYDAGLEHCLSIIDTEPNPNGAIAVSMQEPLRIAYPCPSARGIKVATLNGESSTLFHNTFSTHIQILAFSPSGKKLAATDQDGLTVYSFTLPETQQGQILQNGNSVQFSSSPGSANGSLSSSPSSSPKYSSSASVKSYRRGTQKCRMTSLCFNAIDEDILCCSSDHGTIHIFNINPSASLLSMAGTVLWNFQIKDEHIPKSAVSHTSWCHFSSDSSHLYRVVDHRVYIYNLDLNPQRLGATLLLMKDLGLRK
jgi:WD40 repeat protein